MEAESPQPSPPPPRVLPHSYTPRVRLDSPRGLRVPLNLVAALSDASQTQPIYASESAASRPQPPSMAPPAAVRPFVSRAPPAVPQRDPSLPKHSWLVLNEEGSKPGPVYRAASAAQSPRFYGPLGTRPAAFPNRPEMLALVEAQAAALLASQLAAERLVVSAQRRAAAATSPRARTPTSANRPPSAPRERDGSPRARPPASVNRASSAAHDRLASPRSQRPASASGSAQPRDGGDGGAPDAASPRDVTSPCELPRQPVHSPASARSTHPPPPPARAPAEAASPSARIGAAFSVALLGVRPRDLHDAQSTAAALAAAAAQAAAEAAALAAAIAAPAAAASPTSAGAAIGTQPLDCFDDLNEPTCADEAAVLARAAAEGAALEARAAEAATDNDRAALSRFRVFGTEHDAGGAALSGASAPRDGGAAAASYGAAALNGGSGGGAQRGAAGAGPQAGSVEPADGSGGGYVCWAPCRVHAYDAPRRLFLIEWDHNLAAIARAAATAAAAGDGGALAAGARGAHGSAGAGGEGALVADASAARRPPGYKWVRRLNLKFEQEDGRAFDARVARARAVRARALARQAARLGLAVAPNEIAAFQPEWSRRLRRLAALTPRDELRRSMAAVARAAAAGGSGGGGGGGGDDDDDDDALGAATHGESPHRPHTAQRAQLPPPPASPPGTAAVRAARPTSAAVVKAARAPAPSRVAARQAAIAAAAAAALTDTLVAEASAEYAAAMEAAIREYRTGELVRAFDARPPAARFGTLDVWEARGVDAGGLGLTGRAAGKQRRASAGGGAGGEGYELRSPTASRQARSPREPAGASFRRPLTPSAAAAAAAAAMAAVAADNVELPAGADERARRDAHAASFARARESIALNLFRARPAVNATMSTIWREGLALGAAIEAKLPSAAAAERAEPEELSPLRHRPFEFSPRALAAQPPALATKVAKAAQPAAGGGAATKASAADGDASASPLPRLGPSIATLEQFEAGQRAACERWREHLVYHWLSHSESTLVSGLQEHAVFNMMSAHEYHGSEGERLMTLASVLMSACLHAAVYGALAQIARFFELHRARRARASDDAPALAALEAPKRAYSASAAAAPAAVAAAAAATGLVDSVDLSLLEFETTEGGDDDDDEDDEPTTLNARAAAERHASRPRVREQRTLLRAGASASCREPLLAVSLVVRLGPPVEPARRARRSPTESELERGQSASDDDDDDDDEGSDDEGYGAPAISVPAAAAADGVAAAAADAEQRANADPDAQAEAAARGAYEAALSSLPRFAGAFTLDPPLARVLEACARGVDLAADAALGIPSAPPRALSLLQLAEECIAAPGASDPTRARARAAVASVVASASAGPAALLRAFESFELLALLNEGDFVLRLDRGAAAARAAAAATRGRGESDGDATEETDDDDDDDLDSDADDADDDDGGGGGARPHADARAADALAEAAAARGGGLVSAALLRACVPWSAHHGAPLEELHARALALDALGARARSLSLGEVKTGLLIVRTADAQEALAARAERLCEAVCGLISARLAARALGLSERFAQLHAILTQDAKDAEAVAEMAGYLDAYPETVLALEARVGAEVLEQLALLDEVRRPLSDEALAAAVALSRWPGKVESGYDDAAMRLDRARTRAMNELVDERLAFSEMLDAARAELERITKLGGAGCNVDETAPQVVEFAQRLADARARVRVFNAREQIFGLERSEWPLLAEHSAAIEPYHAMWHAANEFSKAYPGWFDGPLVDVSVAHVELGVATCSREIARATVALAGCAAPLRVVDDLSKRLDEAREMLPLVAAMLNPGMRDRHWQTLSAAAGVIRVPSQMSTLRMLIDSGVPEHLPLIEEVSLVATKEFALERVLDRMVAEWAGVSFELAPYRATGVSVLNQIDPVQALLDEHVLKAQAMRSSAFIRPFERRVRGWEAALLGAQEALDTWVKVQAVWLYLEPIFGSVDILRQMPAEAARFAHVDGLWRKLMAATGVRPQALECLQQEGLQATLAECAAALEIVQRGLSAYLETKRLAFCRLYFLSNDELLQILSETADPERVQPHLRKCFEGVERLQFEGEAAERVVVALCSDEDERVQLLAPVRPAEARGLVEVWLAKVELAMREALRVVSVKGALAALKAPVGSSARDRFVLGWPGMAVIAVTRAEWTATAEAALAPDPAAHGGGLVAFCDAQRRSLDGLVLMVRGRLERAQRLTVEALVTLDVHARDIAYELRDKGVARADEFDWLAQMRFYWSAPLTNLHGAFGLGAAAVPSLSVRMLTADGAYGYEYLGNTPRLVVTPLTDRCYRTLMSALQLYLGGAPEGPAGTGKTETTKDLAKALAKQCVVFNCSDGLDYLSMGRMFRGVASCGAWACFDEFNRIDVEVLSVVAQQILTIQRALAARAPGGYFLFEGTQLPLDPTCAVFITMNPGYAGRSELPDNLKALFRPVAMMVPDYALIGEISLYSAGFQDARALARKLVQTYKLCSEQLSSQEHYDYGMRAVKSVLNAAGNLKRTAPPTADESRLCLRALRDVNVPKFVSHDIVLFDGITQDLFPKVQPLDTSDAALAVAVRTAAGRLGLQPTEPFVAKVLELADMVAVRHGIMLVGPPAGGKSSAYKTLAAAYTQLADAQAEAEAEAEAARLAAEAAAQAAAEAALARVGEDVSASDEGSFSRRPSDPTRRLSLVPKPSIGEGSLASASRAAIGQWPSGAPQPLRRNSNASGTVSRRSSRTPTLDSALTEEAAAGGGGGSSARQYARVHTPLVNPKALSLGRLYGEFDKASHEWADGVLATQFRLCASDRGPDRYWLVLDGPVDAEWIESMNTVLDDNKKLCLVSGEIIAMSARMNLLFETADLAHASPATVSRCGMVYLEPRALGWRPLVASWLEGELPPAVAERPEAVAHLQALCEWLLPPLLWFVRARCASPLGWASLGDGVLVGALLRSLSAHMYGWLAHAPKGLRRRRAEPKARAARKGGGAPAAGREPPPPLPVVGARPQLVPKPPALGAAAARPGTAAAKPKRGTGGAQPAAAAEAAPAAAPAGPPPLPSGLTTDAQLLETLSSLFVFCLTWSVCAPVDAASRRACDEFVRSLCAREMPAALAAELAGAGEAAQACELHASTASAADGREHRGGEADPAGAPLAVEARSRAARRASALGAEHRFDTTVLGFELVFPAGLGALPVPPREDEGGGGVRAAPLAAGGSGGSGGGGGGGGGGKGGGGAAASGGGAAGSTLFDYVYRLDERGKGGAGGVWTAWRETLPLAPPLAAAASLHSLIVPTALSTALGYQLRTLLAAGASVLVVGATGTGKTSTVHAVLGGALCTAAASTAELLAAGKRRPYAQARPPPPPPSRPPADGAAAAADAAAAPVGGPIRFRSLHLHFSARTGAAATQAQIDGALEKRRKGVYGPPHGWRHFVFVDDLAMPTVEAYGAQPPLELLRQLADQGGWYELKGGALRTLQDVQLVGAMAPAGGGRNTISARCSRHLHALAAVENDERALCSIFDAIVGAHLEQGASGPGAQGGAATAAPPASAADKADAERAGRFDVGVRGMRAKLVLATVRLHAAVAAALLPTPTKPHYAFSLRDMSRLALGLCRSTPALFRTPESMQRLWAHEAERVYQDRLAEPADARAFRALLDDQLGAHFKTSRAALVGAGGARADAAAAEPDAPPPPLIFTTFVPAEFETATSDPADADADAPRAVLRARAGAEAPPYADARGGVGAVLAMLRAYLAELNASVPREPLPLVLFEYAALHVCRLARVLLQPAGHALLIGVGGSGRQSLARLATHVVGGTLFHIDRGRAYGVNEWRDDLRRLLALAGCASKLAAPKGDGGSARRSAPVVLCLADGGLSNDAFLEDINALLNLGEVPNLFAPDERSALLEDVAAFAKACAADGAELPGGAGGGAAAPGGGAQADGADGGAAAPDHGGLGGAPAKGVERTPAQLWTLFVQLVRARLRVVLALSPIGTALRARLRAFPSLVACCTIDWFEPWPDDALRSVAAAFLADPAAGLPTLLPREALGVALVAAHETAARASAALFAASRRVVYVTPTRYLELLHTFGSLLASRRDALDALKARYDGGLEKLASTAEQVTSMTAELTSLQPALKVAQAEAEALLLTIKRDSADAERTRAVVEAEEAAALEQAAGAKAIKEECMAQLAEAEPALAAAVKALATLRRDDIVEVKSLKTPPMGVKLTMEAVCIMLGVAPNKAAAGADETDPAAIPDRYWEPARKLLAAGAKFLQRLLEYDRDAIPQAHIDKALAFLARAGDDFEPEKIRTVNRACEGLCLWVRSMVQYDRVSKQVRPKRVALAQAEADYRLVSLALAEKKAALAAVEANLAAIQAQLDATLARKLELLTQVGECETRLERAMRLVGGLGGERERWQATAARLGAEYRSLVGDSFIAAAFVTYLGPHAPSARAECATEWLRLCERLGLPSSAGLLEAERAAAVAAAEEAERERGGDGRRLTLGGGARRPSSQANAVGGARESSLPKMMTGGRVSKVAQEQAAAAAEAVRAAEQKRLQRAAGPACAFSLADVLGNAIALREWAADGLPNDQLSVENALVMQTARRWPLLIDPQGQATRWIRNRERRRAASAAGGAGAGAGGAARGRAASVALIALTQSDADLSRSIESALEFGLAVLVEGLAETVDSSLMALSSILNPTAPGGAQAAGGAPRRADGARAPTVRIGESFVDVSPSFRLYLCTRLHNPHYLPEVSTFVTLCNFAVTRAGLEDQLLGVLVGRERPELEAEKARLVADAAASARALADVEERILTALSSARGSILDDQTAVDVLSASKRLADEIGSKQRQAEGTKRALDGAREAYASVAARAATLFFTLAELPALSPLYQFSLAWFCKLFERATAVAPRFSVDGGKGGATAARRPQGGGGGGASGALGQPQSAAAEQALAKRLAGLQDELSCSTFRSVCRSLQARHALPFALSMLARALEERGELHEGLWRFVMTGGASLDDDDDDAADERQRGGEPAAAFAARARPPWLSARGWAEIRRLASLDGAAQFEGLDRSVGGALSDAWRAVADADEPHGAPLPPPYDARLDGGLDRLALVRALRPDQLVAAARECVRVGLGPVFAEAPTLDLAAAFEDSAAACPLLFILSPGADPMARVLALADELGVGAGNVLSVSLGQGQAALATSTLEEGASNGAWVVLQNCHLATSFMPALERRVASLADDGGVHVHFRLWLTSAPTDALPISVLQACVKLTLEPPAGLRANLQSLLEQQAPIADARFFHALRDDEGAVGVGPRKGTAAALAAAARERGGLEPAPASTEPAECAYRRLLFNLAFFHALAQERRSYGPLGWNVPYDFSQADLAISARQLRRFVHQATERATASTVAAAAAEAAAEAAAAAAARAAQLKAAAAAGGEGEAASGRLPVAPSATPTPAGSGVAAARAAAVAAPGRASRLGSDASESGASASEAAAAQAAADAAAAEAAEAAAALDVKALEARVRAVPVPYDALHYLIGEANYGGRVTDDKDRRTLASLVRHLLSADALGREFTLAAREPDADVLDLVRRDLAVGTISAAKPAGAADAAGAGAAATAADDDPTSGALGVEPPSASGLLAAYVPPPLGSTLEAARAHVRALPASTPPEVVGLHANAAIARDVRAGRELCADVLACRPRAAIAAGPAAVAVNAAAAAAPDSDPAASAQAADDDAAAAAAAAAAPGAAAAESGAPALHGDDALIDRLAADVSKRIGAPFDIDAATRRFPVAYLQSMNTMLVQELARFNKLTDTVRETCRALRQAVRGLEVMDSGLDAAASALRDGRVPEAWLLRSYPSLKPLGSYVADLGERLAYLRGWIERGPPSRFWLSGFFFTQAFLTGVLQNHARKGAIPIDDLAFDFQPFGPAPATPAESERDVSSQALGHLILPPPPVDGVHVYGLHLEGGRFSLEAKRLAESLPGQLHAPMPLLWLRPALASDLHGALEPHYEVPLYRTSERRGTLSTTGHSTNFVMFLRLPTDVPADHWVKRGLAALCQLDD